MDKEIPKIFQDKKNCCGCGACYSICPKNAISMVQDEEGFLYPKIDSKKCINCKKCIQICAFKKRQNSKNLF